MTTLTTHLLRQSVAESLVNSFQDDSTSYYLFIGHIMPWANEAAPESANNSSVYYRDSWRKMIAAKRIRGDSVRLVVPRLNWTANTVYTQYDDLSNTIFTDSNSKLYAITQNNYVYKCIDNANNSNSTVEPSGLTNNDGFIHTNDGYVWKYMFTVDSTDNPFFTEDYIPAPSTNDSSAIVVSGSVDRIAVTANGFGYNSSVAGNNLSIVSITGDGTGATATANVGSNGKITAVTVGSIGSGYTYANVEFSGSGSSALARAILSPYLGHASRPAEELGANKAFLALKLGVGDATEGNTFTVQNDFRQFGIIKNPYKYNSTTVANANAVVQTTNITVVVDSNPAFSIDDYVYQSDVSGNTVFSGYVVDISNFANTSLVKVTETVGNPVVGELLYNANNVTSKRIQSYDNPDLQRYTGKILYLENVTKVQRNISQSETFRIVFDF